MEANLTKVSLQELIDSERIIHEYFCRMADHKKCLPRGVKEQLSEGGSKLEFYVNEETNLSFPLRLFIVNDHTLVPNIPIHRVDFQDEIYFDLGSPIFNFGARYTIMNVKTVWESWFGKSESGWGKIEHMLLSESCTKRTWSSKSLKSNSFIEYIPK